jgi:hypothetical protein
MHARVQAREDGSIEGGMMTTAVDLTDRVEAALDELLDAVVELDKDWQWSGDEQLSLYISTLKLRRKYDRLLERVRVEARRIERGTKEGTENIPRYSEGTQR